MPRLAANLHYMFDEVPFLDRFAMIQSLVTGTVASVALPRCLGARKNSGTISRQP